jgi:hypothetical protein
MVEVTTSRGRLSSLAHMICSNGRGSSHRSIWHRACPLQVQAQRRAWEAHQKAQAPSRATTDHAQFTLLTCQSCWRSEREESLGQAHGHVQCVPK